ncbi:hypothetical protein NC652_033070 [Populus alba x Populus x berolinensis]|nr:hypothetical protein NC652_033070 [Populus alba x Populus x berolinensis]
MKVMGLNMLDIMACGTWNPEAKVERKDQLEVVVFSPSELGRGGDVLLKVAHCRVLNHVQRPRPSNQQFLEERPNRASDPVKSLIYFNMASRPYKYERDTKLGPMFSGAISQPECKT